MRPEPPAFVPAVCVWGGDTHPVQPADWSNSVFLDRVKSYG